MYSVTVHPENPSTPLTDSTEPAPACNVRPFPLKFLVTNTLVHLDLSRRTNHECRQKQRF